MTRSDGADVDQLRRCAALLGATGVGMGAFGAHALNATLTQRGKLDNWRTATLYHLLQAAAVLGVSALAAASDSNGDGNGNSGPTSTDLLRAGQLMTAGTAMFSGSIYLLCLGIGPAKVLGPTTPIGGLLMIGGWYYLM